MSGNGLTDGEPINFQIFSDQSDGRHLARILHGTLANNGNALQALNHACAGVFLMVNAGGRCFHRICDAHRRSAEKHRG